MGLLDSLFHAAAPAASDPCLRLHDALRHRSRYVAVVIGAGGWIPHPSKDTFSRAYGDCKDLSTLYASMLAPTLVYHFVMGMYSEPKLPWRIVWAGYLGVFLLGAVLLALGSFISSLTEKAALHSGQLTRNDMVHSEA